MSRVVNFDRYNRRYNQDIVLSPKDIPLCPFAVNLLLIPSSGQPLIYFLSLEFSQHHVYESMAVCSVLSLTSFT